MNCVGDIDFLAATQHCLTDLIRDGMTDKDDSDALQSPVPANAYPLNRKTSHANQNQGMWEKWKVETENRRRS